MACACASYGDDTVSPEDIAALLGLDLQQQRLDTGGVFAMESRAMIRQIIMRQFPLLRTALEDAQKWTQIEQQMQRTPRTLRPLGPVQATLDQLYTAGYQLFVLTNDDRDSTEKALRKLGLNIYFTATMTADAGFGRKPESTGLLHLLQTAGIPPNRAVMVGDSAADRTVANHAAVRYFVGVSEDYPHATASLGDTLDVIADIGQLPALLAQFN